MAEVLVSPSNKFLPETVKDKYEVINFSHETKRAIFAGFKGVTVDFSKLTEQQAEALIARKFPHLRRKTTASA